MPEKTISFRIAIILGLFGINDGIQKWAPLKFQALAKIYIFAIKYRLQVRALIIDEINDIITYTKRVPRLAVKKYLHKYTNKDDSVRALISSQPVTFIILQEMLNNITTNSPKDDKDFIILERSRTLLMIR